MLPGGSTNVFARTIGMTNDPIEATGELLGRPGPAARSAGSASGNVNGRYFLFHVGHRLRRRRGRSRSSGARRSSATPVIALFVYAAFATWFRHYDRSRPRFAVRGPPAPGGGPETVIDDAYFAICLKTNPYTFLGNRPLDVAPDTGFDSRLSLVTFRTLDMATMLTMAASALRSGRLLRRHRRLSNAAGLDRISVTGVRSGAVPGRRRLPRDDRASGAVLGARGPHPARALIGRRPGPGDRRRPRTGWFTPPRPALLPRHVAVLVRGATNVEFSAKGLRQPSETFTLCLRASDQGRVRLYVNIFTFSSGRYGGVCGPDLEPLDRLGL